MRKIDVSFEPKGKKKSRFFWEDQHKSLVLTRTASETRVCDQDNEDEKHTQTHQLPYVTMMGTQGNHGTSWDRVMGHMTILGVDNKNDY